MDKPLPLDQALLFSLQIARGMNHAVEKIPDLVHRDLKPENILVGKDKIADININRLRITDFGLASIFNPTRWTEIGQNGGFDSSRTNNNRLTQGSVGTPLYMAPELWECENVGLYTDIYALGCILFELLTGQYVALGRTINDLQVSHCTGKLHRLPENLPIELQKFLSNCLAFKPSERYQSWKIVESDLEQMLTTLCGITPPKKIFSVTDNRNEQIQVSWSYNVIGCAYRDIGKADIKVVRNTMIHIAIDEDLLDV